MDPLTRVFQGQEGTGSAQIFPGSSYDPVADAANRRNRVEQDLDLLKKTKQAKAKEAQKKLQDYSEVKLDAWDIDIQKALQEDKSKLLEMATQYYSQGVDPFDPMNADAFFNLKKGMDLIQNKTVSSKQHQKIYTDQLNTLVNNEDEYDVEESKKRLEAFRNAESIEERSKLAQDLLVPKVKTFDLLEDLNKKMIPLVKQLETESKSSFTNPDGSVTTVNVRRITEDDLRTLAESNLKNQEVIKTVNAQYLSLSDQEKGKYNGPKDYYFQNYMKEWAKNENLTVTTKGFSPDGKNKRPPQQEVNNRDRNINAILGAYSSNPDIPNTNAKAALGSLVGGKYMGKYIASAEFMPKESEEKISRGKTIKIDKPDRLVLSINVGVSAGEPVYESVEIDLNDPSSYNLLNGIMNTSVSEDMKIENDYLQDLYKTPEARSVEEGVIGGDPNKKYVPSTTGGSEAPKPTTASKYEKYKRQE